MSPRSSDGPILVRDGEHGLPYSKGLMANAIASSGLAPGRAYLVAQAIEDRLREGKRDSVEASELRQITLDAIKQEAGERYAESYRKWQTVQSLDLPLVILIGGGTGVGKSTIATQLAARLGVVRIISTDAIREVMKSTFSREFMPTLYRSSFDTADVVKAKSTRSEDALLVGYRDQVAAVSVGVQALIERAIKESTDLVIEGAHLVPGFIDTTPFERDAVIVWCVIQVEDEGVHRSHFYVRAHETRARPVERYLAGFGNIRKIQKYIKSAALQHGTPIISNYNLDQSLAAVIDLVMSRAVEAAKGTQRKVRSIRDGSR
ncbi:MAG: 2-phosphoglycerate kinase [Actinomycetota bacterium]|nr:2-phosphoglycerate kinase [Actinomycetota bacterium]